MNLTVIKSGSFDVLEMGEPAVSAAEDEEATEQQQYLSESFKARRVNEREERKVSFQPFLIPVIKAEPIDDKEAFVHKMRERVKEHISSDIIREGADFSSDISKFDPKHHSLRPLALILQMTSAENSDRPGELLLEKHMSRLVGECIQKFQNLERDYNFGLQKNRTLERNETAEVERDLCVESSDERNQQRTSWEAEQESAKPPVRNWCAEFDEILCRRAIVVLERFDLSPSPVVSMRQSKTENEAGASEIEILFESLAVKKFQGGLFEADITVKALEQGLRGGAAPRMRKGKSDGTLEDLEKRVAECNLAARRRRIKYETQKERKKRVSASNLAMRRRIENETPEERKRRLSACNLAMRRRIANETPEEREKRLAASRLSIRRRLASETLKERKKRLFASNLAMRRRIENETPEEREKRLLACNLATRKRIANETPEQREIRLTYSREAARRRSVKTN